MNQKITNIFHNAYTFVFLVLIVLPVYMFLDPILFFSKNGMPGYALESVFGIETLFSIIAVILLIISAIHNIKLKNRLVTPSRTPFLILTALAFVTAAFPFVWAFAVQNPYGAMIIVLTGPIALVLWAITLVMGFSMLRSK